MIMNKKLGVYFRFTFFSVFNVLLFVTMTLGLNVLYAAESMEHINKNTEVGWFFVDDKAKKPKAQNKPNKPKPKLVVLNVPKKAKKIDCTNPRQWNTNCGFVDPTHLDMPLNQAYQFEQQQMKWLMRNAALYPNDIKATDAYQRFNWWAVNNAMTMSYTWQYNQAQHPELDPMVKNPTSQFALLMVANIESQRKASFFKLLSKSSFLVYYTRTDCKYCHIQAPIIQRVAKETGLKVYNASLDKGHIKGFKDYLTAPQTLKPAQILQVTTVPTLFLYLKPKKDDASQSQQWIRISTGLTTADIIQSRIIDFVRAYRHSIVTGFKDGKKTYSPDFSQDGMNKLAIENTSLDVPTQAQVVQSTFESKPRYVNGGKR